jgi:cell division protease FtsH
MQRVANIAKRMVEEFGMSDRIGQVSVSEGRERPAFWGMRMLRRPTQWGQKIRTVVEEEVERLVNNSYVLAKKILQDNRALLEHLTKVLMEQEVVSAEEFQMMLVEFKARTVDYVVLNEAKKNRDALPFQTLPATM